MALITEKSTIKTEATFSPDRKHRYLLRKEWDKSKDKATVIMVNPASATDMRIDHTTMYVLNNLVRLGFGGCDIVNLYSRVSSSTKEDNTSNEVNDNQILQSARTSSHVIVAWGKLGDTNKRVAKRQKEVVELLKPCQDKLFVIGDSVGNTGFHPLSPRVHEWNLKTFKALAEDEGKETDKQEQKEGKEKVESKSKGDQEDQKVETEAQEQ